MAIRSTRRSNSQDVELPIDDLKFDLHNPRMPEETFDDEESLIRFMIVEFDIEELVQSILPPVGSTTNLLS
jgi:hypothetical protein